MPQRNYLQHGSRHRTEGTDPIPGLGINWASNVAASIVTVPAWSAGSPGVSNIDMSHTTMYTNASSIFAINSVTLGGTPFYGVSAKTPGHYLAKAMVTIGNGDTAGTVECSWSATPGFEAAYGTAGFTFLPIAGGLRGHVQTMPYMETLVTCASITYPTDPFIIQVSNFSGASCTAYVEMIVIQMDTDTTTIF